MKFFTPRFSFIVAAILIAAISRLFPHIPNFTPIASMALFGGVYLDKRLSLLIPLIAMFLSDIAMQLVFGWGFHNTMIYVYVSFCLTSLIGMMVRLNITFLSIAAGSIISSIMFFIITNFGVWASGADSSIVGLQSTYLLGIPFFAPTLLGDMFFNSILFGSFYLAQIKYKILI